MVPTEESLFHPCLAPTPAAGCIVSHLRATPVAVCCCLVTKLCLTLATPWIVAGRPLCPWDFLGKNTGVGCHFLLQGIFMTQGLNLCLLRWQEDSLPVSHQGNPLLQLLVFPGWVRGGVGCVHKNISKYYKFLCPSLLQKMVVSHTALLI